MTVSTVPTTREVVDVQTPFGYTLSLALFVLPTTALAVWGSLKRADNVPRKAMVCTIIAISPLGFLLDIFLGLLFFDFPNKEATVNVRLLGYDWASGTWVKGIPLEEFIFYLSGIAFVTVAYLWLDECFLSEYNIADYSKHEQCRPGMLQLYWPALILGAALAVIVLLIREYGPARGQPGFPGWAMFEIAVGFVPAAVLFPSVRPFINWPAFGLVSLYMLLISVVWEVTLALPYGWWSFRYEQMMGIYIKPWTGLPIEEPVLWVLVSFTTVTVYEAWKIFFHLRAAEAANTRTILLGERRQRIER